MDLRGIRRSVEVTASSAYEAGALAVAALREDGCIEPIRSRHDVDHRGEAAGHHPYSDRAADREWDRERVTQSRGSTAEGRDRSRG